MKILWLTVGVTILDKKWIHNSKLDEIGYKNLKKTDCIGDLWKTKESLTKKNVGLGLYVMVC